ncbi:hypothetical protein ACOSQ2_017175 [Xanthoceras sorbifolium]
MDETSYVLGIQISRNRKMKHLYQDQNNYLDKVLKLFNMTDTKPMIRFIKSTIYLIKNGANNPKAKRIDINYHYILDIVEMGEIKVDYVTFGEMLADPMTKGLSLKKFKKHVTTMDLKSI